jgi:hypothetical protein
MNFEFDKEIDVLLRQTARNGDFVSNNAAHLDADEISAFAENALPEKTRQTYMRHLADCERCRKSLSNIIALNSEFEAETIPAEEKQIASATPIPWYRKLFVFPNLAYSLGALIMVFAGIAAFTVLQSVKQTGSMELSQTYEKQPNGKGMSSDGDEMPNESFSSNSSMASNTMSANSLMSSNAASTNSATSGALNVANPSVPTAPGAMANSNAAISSPRETAEKDVKTEATPVSAPKKPADAAENKDSVLVGAPPPTAKENNMLMDGEVLKQQNQTQNSMAQNQTQIMPDSRNVQRAPSAALRAENKSKKLEESRNDEADKSNSAASVGGKTFKRADNVWYDSAYRGQSTTNVTRGTNEYKKLDSGLRVIAENLGGTIVIVWKQKAYRIH